MTKFQKLRFHVERGSILAVSLTLMLIAAISTISIARTVIELQRTNERRRDLWRAYQHAESGISVVQHWALFPNDYTPDVNLFDEVTTGSTFEERFPAFNAVVNAGGFTITDTSLASMGIGSFNTVGGVFLGIIKEIQILPPDAGDPVASAFKIQTVGESESGIQRTVTAYMEVNPVIQISIPAGLISFDTALAFGNAKIHWGEAWSMNDFNMLNRSQMTYIVDDPDPLAAYRTEQTINFPNNWQTSAAYTAYKLYDTSADQPGLFPTGDGDFAEVFYQNVPAGTLEWPDLASEYEAFKDLALLNDRYYTTNSSGDVLKDGEVVDFLDEFGVADRSTAPMDLVFIDTTDGNPPAADGSNLATINVSGNSLGLKGIYYINAHMNAGGVGSPPALAGVENPNTGSIETLSQIFLDGVLYSAGQVDMAGNAGVYGSVVAERGFGGGGTPDIYYNRDLADGLNISNGNIGSPFIVVLETNSGQSTLVP